MPHNVFRAHDEFPVYGEKYLKAPLFFKVSIDTSPFLTEISSNHVDVNAFLTKYFQNPLNLPDIRPPGTFDEFFDLLVQEVPDFAGQEAGHDKKDLLIEEFKADYKTLALDPDLPTLSFLGFSPNESEILAQLKGAFKYFLQKHERLFPNGPNNPNDPNLPDFFENFYEFISPNLSIRADYAPIVNNSLKNEVVSYQDVFEHFLRDSTSQEFQTEFKLFYEEELAFTKAITGGENGFFLPAIAFPKWVERIRDKYNETLNIIPPLDVTSLEAANFEKVLILDRIFLILVELLGTLQDTAAVQADRLQFLTTWQKQYTDRLTQVPVFPSGNIIQGDPADTAVQQERSSANAYSSAFQEKVRSWRSVVQDDAKALQSSINTSTNSVTQQANIATSIIQQFSTILSAIFR